MTAQLSDASFGLGSLLDDPSGVSAEKLAMLDLSPSTLMHDLEASWRQAVPPPPHIIQAPAPPPRRAPVPPPVPTPRPSGYAECHVELHAGWTWFSLRALPEDTSLNTVLGGLRAHAGDLIKSQTQFALFYDGYGFFGALTAVRHDSMYAIKLRHAASLVSVGPAAPLDTPLVLHAGWSWLPYLRPGSASLNEGLPVHAYAANDAIKSRTAFAHYYDGYGWYGSLGSLVPGYGYMLKVASAGTTSYAL